MRLDKIKFAKLIGFLERVHALNFDESDIEALDYIIDVDIPKASEYVEAAKVDELLRQLNATDGFIPAIKAYRVLTGAGLKESKEAIERYRSIPKFPVKEESANLVDSLRNAKVID